MSDENKTLDGVEAVSALSGQMTESEISDIETVTAEADREASIQARFAELDAQAKEAAKQRAAFYASYHHDRQVDRKADLERVQREAEAERRRAYAHLNEDKLLKQFAQTNPETLEDKAMLVALSEVIGEMHGNFRRPARRVLKSEGMTRTLSPDEVNAHYLSRVRPSLDTTVSLDAPLQEADATIAKINAILDLMERKRIEAEEFAKLPVPKKRVTLKQYFFRVALLVLRRPINFTIRFLTAFRDAK